MLVELRPVSTIRPYPGNPRCNDDAVDAVARSLQEFGFRQPIVVDRDDVVVVGHTRLKAAQKLGFIEVPVHVATELTPAQAQAYRIADNQTATIATWDDDRLVEELLALREQNFDLNLTGFDDDELSRLLRDPDPELQGDPDDVPESPTIASTNRGDIWELGTHRLICGDASNPDVYARLLAGDSVDLLLTDPPYNVAYQGKTADELVIENDNLSVDAYHQFLVSTLTPATHTLKPGAAFYIWHADLFGDVVRTAVRDVGLSLKQVVVWNKSAFALGRNDYHWQHEPALYGWKPGAAHTWLGGRAQSTVLNFDKPSRNADHPTMKPVALFQQLITNSCPQDGIVLDPFGGSGTTLIAAQTSGRIARLVELDPIYCDVIVNRWEQRKHSLNARGQRFGAVVSVGRELALLPDVG